MHQGEAAEDARGRRDMYRFLASVFLAAPAPDVVRILGDAAFLDGLAEALGEEAVSPLRETTAGSPPDPETIRLDHDALFRVPAGRYVAPYESVYAGRRRVEGREKPGLLMGAPFRRVREFFASAGYSLGGESRELADHAGHELDFVACLCGEESEAWEAEDPEGAARARSLELRFLERHLGAWMPALCETIQEKARTSLYRGIGRLAGAFVAADLELLRRDRGGGREGEG